MSNNVLLVIIENTGADCALYVNGTKVLSATQEDGGEAYSMVESAASNMAEALDTPLFVENVMMDDDWNWDDVTDHLVKTNLIILPDEKTFDFQCIVELDDGQSEIIETVTAKSLKLAIKILLDRVKQSDDYHALMTIKNLAKYGEPIPVLLNDNDDPDESPNDYTLVPALSNSCWITVGNLSVQVARTDEGVVVDVYPLNREDEDVIASTYGFFAEGEDKYPA